MLLMAYRLHTSLIALPRTRDSFIWDTHELDMSRHILKSGEVVVTYVSNTSKAIRGTVWMQCFRDKEKPYDESLDA